MPTKNITIEQVSKTDGTNQRGKPYTKWGIKDQDGEWFNSFRDSQGNLAQEHEGTEAVFQVTYETNEKFHSNDLIELAGPVRNEGVAAAPAKKKEAEVDWDAKERRDFKSRAWAIATSAAGPMANQYADSGQETAKDYYNRVKPLQSAIYLDVCADLLAGDESIPF